MAVYEYFCKVCNYWFEVNKPMASINEDQKCLRCGQKAERQFSTSLGAVIFKGQGFYKTDNKKEKKNDERRV